MTEAFEGFAPGRLWSLWDMFKTGAGDMVRLGEDMEAYWELWRRAGDDRSFEPGTAHRAGLQALIKQLTKLGIGLDMPRSVVSALDTAHSAPGALPASQQALLQLLNLFKAELRSRVALVLDPRDSELYGMTEPFGPAVAEKFRDAADDIERAAKCLALAQPTASMFHQMRAMERMVQALASKLGIGNTEREWGKILSDIDGEIAKMPRDSTRDCWSEVRANLHHVKQAWRNNTMHPKKSYDTAEAKEVFEAMRAFSASLVVLV